MQSYAHTVHTYRVVTRLTDLHPEGILLTDKDGNLPLHLACKSGSVTITSQLLHLSYSSRKSGRMIKKMEEERPQKREIIDKLKKKDNDKKRCLVLHTLEKK